MTKEELWKLQSTVMNMTEFRPDQPNLGDTHCNSSLRVIAKAFDYEFPDIMANDMIDLMGQGGRWKTGNFGDATFYALNGKLAVLGKKYDIHGHVASVSPEPMQKSPSAGYLVPIVANIGKAVGRMLASHCFTILDANGLVIPTWAPEVFLLD